MKVVWGWLLELCDLDRQVTAQEGAAALTRGGLEIEAVTALGDAFAGVVVAEVVGKRPHPNADKLTLVDVITERGGTATQVVCGAPNVPATGRRVLWARVGAKLPGGITLAEKPVKGVVSPGMLCSDDELGIADGKDGHAGIVVLDADDATPLGAPAQRALGLDDHVLEINAPANRGDVLGHLGVARELCAMVGGKLVTRQIDVGGEPAAEVAVTIADPANCPRYTCRVVDGLRLAPAPRRIAARLRAVGMRPISNLVDITNYVMFELGQPLHAFDLDRLTAKAIHVGPAVDTETVVTLDGQTRTLVGGDLVIRDGPRAVALAGVMGGLDTEVVDTTRRVLLEAASFSPGHVRRTARRLGLHSESSHRFERGVDPEVADLASRRAVELMALYAGGRPAGHVDAYPGKRVRAAVRVRLPRVRALTGVAALDATSCAAALTRLGCEVTPADGDAIAVLPPTARADIAREVDAIEEILRVVGYEQVASSLPVLRVAPPLRAADRADHARAALVACGASEAITFAFQSIDRCASLGVAATDRRAQPIAIRNPMSADQAVMRTSLVPNLVAAVARNVSFGRADVDLFEVGSVFLRRGEAVVEAPPAELPDEPTWVAGVLAGRRPAGVGAGAAYDAFDAKARAVVAIRAIAGDVAVDAVATRAIRYLHPGIAGELRIDVDGERRTVGWFGELHPEVRKRLGVTVPVYVYEIEVGALPVAPPAQMRPIPRFPAAARDVSLLLGTDVPAGRVTAVIAGIREPLVTGIRLLEDYRDAKLGDGMKSMLWSIDYRALDRTLTDAEIDRAHEAIVARLVAELPAQRR